MSESVKGILAMVAACFIWGLSGLFYKEIAHVPPLEVLSHRTLWSLVYFLLLLSLQGRLQSLRQLVLDFKALPVIAFASVMISLNWFYFIYGVQVGRAVEASLGYYMFPLIAVLLGMVMFGERLRKLQWMAVGLAFIAVTILTVGLKVVPVISLILAVSFGLYGAVKKWISAGPVLSVTVEVLLLAPLAFIWLWGVHTQGWQGLTGRAGGYFGTAWFETGMLMFAGVMTATPLVLFSYASKRAPLATVGLVQYLNPTLQACVAVFAFGEVFTLWHMIAFTLIWTGLAIYSFDGLRRETSLKVRQG